MDRSADGREDLRWIRDADARSGAEDDVVDTSNVVVMPAYVPLARVRSSWGLSGWLEAVTAKSRLL